MGEVFYNSEFINEQEIVIKISNRAFNYGDGFFETIKIINTKPFNFSAHYIRFSSACKVLKLKNNQTERSLFSLLNQLIEKNKIVNGVAKIHVNRSGEGKYLPFSDGFEIFISINKESGFVKTTPISLCVFSDEQKTKGKVSNIKSVNALVSVLGAIYAKENGFDNAILKNTDGNFIETTNANLFIIKQGVIYTPPLTEGCLDGTMRKWVFGQVNVIEKLLNSLDIKEADEVFTTNAISGIIPVEVVSIETTKIYKTDFAQQLQEKLISSSVGF
jgi:branched-chain amino acid aminotransferase